mgnify:CR=1 FL=1
MLLRSITLFLLSVVIYGCAPDVQDDFNDVRFELTDQFGNEVIFPDDFKGAPVVMGFIYTNCPDICSFITANLKKIHQEMEDPGDTRFVAVTFDPERDRHEVLQKYAEAFDMNRPPFHFLTGDKETIERFMERMSVRTQVSYTKETESGDELYFINHSDKILLIDEQSRQIMDYGGSMTKPQIIIEDLEKML